MQLKPVTIGNITTENNVFLAPLAGYTNYPFRRLCKGYGAGFCYTEMVSAKGLKYGSENTKELLHTDEHEGVPAAYRGKRLKCYTYAVAGEDTVRLYEYNGKIVGALPVAQP